MSGKRRPAGADERAALETLLRSVIDQRVGESSLRKVAGEIGISAPGLGCFLDGASPHDSTLAKMRKWHLDGAGANGPVLDTARAALLLLVAHLPPADRAPVIRAILTIIAGLHRKQGSAGPPWLAPLCMEYGARADDVDVDSGATP